MDKPIKREFTVILASDQFKSDSVDADKDENEYLSSSDGIMTLMIQCFQMHTSGGRQYTVYGTDNCCTASVQ
jgi:hypothetical protein